ncbi:proline iminopeptidase-family hydrolase [Chloroflexota bacterium]
MKTEEGKIGVEDEYQIWYRRVGNGGIPLLTLHGGPGAGHDYLEPLDGLAADRPVIFYDQLGCGKSDQPDDRSLWRMERFVTEVDTVRRALGLEQIHLLGHSWGGWLAIEYILTRPAGVRSLILASTSAGLPEYVRVIQHLIAILPPDIRDTLQRYEAAGELHHPDYEVATLKFYQHHLCRLDPWPDALDRSVQNITGNPVYEIMQGPNEFTVTGNLKDWDRTDQLGEISVPTLITVGRYDEVTPACAETLHQGIPNSQMVIFEESAHLAHLEETEKYLQDMAEFLAGVEGKS